MKFALPLIALVAALSAPASSQANVLILDDSGSAGMPQPCPAEQACINLGLTATVVGDFPTFTGQLVGGTWDIAIVQHVNLGGVPTTGDLDALNTFLTTGACSRVVYFSWNTFNQGLQGHPLFASMGVTPARTGVAVPQFLWDAVHPMCASLANPNSMTDYVGFGIDSCPGDAILGQAAAIVGEATPAPSATNGNVIVRNDNRAVYLGLMPHLLDPSPSTGTAFLEDVLTELLAAGAADDFSATAMTIMPAAPAPGGTFDVDVTVASTSAAPQSVRVDLFAGVLEPVPTVPGVGLATLTVMVPAGGSIVANFTGVAAPAMPEPWRLHALANADGALVECNFTNNVQTTFLCFGGGPAGCPFACGDCDLNMAGPSILDALVAAQIAAGLFAATPDHLCACDTDMAGGVTILDALRIAQVAAGLPVAIMCPGGMGGGGTPPPNLAIEPITMTDPTVVNIDLCGPAAMDLVFEYTTDAGATFSLCTAAGTSPITNPGIGIAPGQITFEWDSLADVIITSRPQTTQVRVSAVDPITLASASAISAPFMLTACPGTTEGDLTGMPLPIVQIGDTTGADDTTTISCGFGGDPGLIDHIYGFQPPMTGNYIVTLCGSAFDTMLEIRELDCATGVSVACNDDSCALQSQVQVMLNASSYYWIIVDGWGGDFGPYTLTIDQLVAGCSGTVDGVIMSLPFNDSGDTTLLDNTVTPTCVGDAGDAVYEFTPSMTAQHTISLCGSGYDTGLEVRDFNCAFGASIGCVDDSCGLQSELVLFLNAGTTYYIIIDGFAGSVGPYTLNVTSP